MLYLVAISMKEPKISLSNDESLHSIGRIEHYRYFLSTIVFLVQATLMQELYLDISCMTIQECINVLSTINKLFFNNVDYSLLLIIDN
jgi:hypothetical protein